MSHGRWFIFWDDTAGRTMIRCECGQPFPTLRAWQRHMKRVKVQ
jgi:hypothetical protein